MPVDHYGEEVCPFSTVLYEGKPYQVSEVGYGLVRLHQYTTKNLQGEEFTTDCYWVPSEECELIKDLQVSHEREITV